MARFPTLDDIDPAGKRVLLRADLNVPMQDGMISDATRIDRLAPTIRELVRRDGKVVVMSHFGRPDGKPDAACSLRPLAAPLADAIGRPVAFAEDCIGPAAERVVARLLPGEVALLENLRFHKEEEADDPRFARQLAALGDLYVNDAFSAAHRAHASTEALARLLPAAAGRLMQRELEALASAFETPRRPLAALIGGAKVSTKLKLLAVMIDKVDTLIIGGAMANTFLLAQGIAIGRSRCECTMAETARDIVERARRANCRLMLPADAVVARELRPGIASETVAIDRVPADRMILDIGPKTVAAIGEQLELSRTLVWNGPVGAYETPPFAAGTDAIARRVAALTAQGRLLSVAGGGETAAALAQAGVMGAFSYVSTAGGAFLEWLEGRELPGVAALMSR